MKKYSLKLKILLLIFCFMLVSFSSISKADSNDKISEEDYSYEYKKWLELPEEERKNYIMPHMYTINLEDEGIDSSCNAKANVDDEVTLPEKYNTAKNITLTVRNQGVTNSCWAICSTELFEILYAKSNKLDSTNLFSERHVEYSCANVFLDNKIDKVRFNRAVGAGGLYEYAMAYYTSGEGPILYDDMKFENNKDTIDISSIQNKTVQAQLENYTEYPQIYKEYDENNNIVKYTNGEIEEDKIKIYTDAQVEEFRKTIKKQIMQNGAVGVYTYYNNENCFFSEEEGYRYGNGYFYNNTVKNSNGKPIGFNHAVCIIGWDDTYSKDNFKDGCKPANDGAYIALNSWGTEWNSGKGYYYISYDDYFIETDMFGLESYSNIDYDNIYQYDELGMSAQMRSGGDPTVIYGANVFTRNSNSREKLSEIGLTIYNDTDVTVYLNNGKDFKLSDTNIIATANNLKSGYHTIKLENPILIGKTFTIIVKYENEETARIPLEAQLLGNSASKYINVTSNEGESFYSTNGEVFKDFYSFPSGKFKNANVCIKAFTVNETEKNDNNYILNNNWRTIKNSNNMLYGIEEKTSVENLLLNGNFSSKYTAKIYKDNENLLTGNVTTGTVIKIYNGEEVIKEYTTVIYGDTTGDGAISSVDALVIVKNKLGIENFKNEVYEEAGKVTSNTRTLNLTPSAIDALAVVKHKLDIEKISQM